MTGFGPTVWQQSIFMTKKVVRVHLSTSNVSVFLKHVSKPAMHPRTLVFINFTSGVSFGTLQVFIHMPGFKDFMLGIWDIFVGVHAN